MVLCRVLPLAAIRAAEPLNMYIWIQLRSILDLVMFQIPCMVYGCLIEQF